jgi:hypothetical protein
MKNTTPTLLFLKRLLAVMALSCLLAAIYLFVILPAQLHWGATPQEMARSMPGDDLVPSPDFLATRAVTIRGKPEEIWPWLAQMGYRRAGYYGYDLIENIGSERGIRSAVSVLPELQHPKTGDTLPISAVASMVFGQIEPWRYLIWQGSSVPSDGSFVWALYPIDESHTRLVNRARLHYHWNAWSLLAFDLFTEFGDPVAVPRILLGIKGRVEGRPAQPLAEEAAEIMIWVLALAECAAALLLVFRWHRWGRAWLLGFGSGLLFLFVLYAHAPIWIGAVIACAILGIMLITLRGESRHSIGAAD